MTSGFWSDYRQTFRGPYGWTMWYATIWAVIVVAALFWLISGLFDAGDTRDQILYATGTLTAVIWLGMIKMWGWIHIVRVRIERRIDAGGAPQR